MATRPRRLNAPTTFNLCQLRKMRLSNGSYYGLDKICSRRGGYCRGVRL